MHNSIAQYTDITGGAHRLNNYETIRKFRGAYRCYEIFRDKLHIAEQRRQEKTAQKLLAITLRYKERLANYVDELYQRCPSLDVLERTILHLLTYQGKAIDLLPLSLRDDKLSSPAASMLATISNLKAAEEFAQRGMRSADSVLLSGSTTWGAFYAVRARLAQKAAGLASDIELEERSDVDLLVVVETAKALQAVIADFVVGGYVSACETQRCKVFLNLRETRGLNMFSLRTHYNGVEVSIHYLLWDTIERICSLQRINTAPESNKFDCLLDFRPNTSASLVKYGGNPLKDLKGLKQAMYIPTFKKICDRRSNQIAGYISQSPIGGKLHLKEQETYFIGIIPFYLLVLPKILLDKGDRLARNIDKLRNNIQEIMQDEVPSYINIADPRMTNDALERVKRSLTKSNGRFSSKAS